MPFPFIPSTLGISFFLVWAFIGAMIFRDSQLAVRRDEEIESSAGKLTASRLTGRPHVTTWKRKRVRQAVVRPAS